MMITEFSQTQSRSVSPEPLARHLLNLPAFPTQGRIELEHKRALEIRQGLRLTGSLEDDLSSGGFAPNSSTTYEQKNGVLISTRRLSFKDELNNKKIIKHIYEITPGINLIWVKLALDLSVSQGYVPTSFSLSYCSGNERLPSNRSQIALTYQDQKLALNFASLQDRETAQQLQDWFGRFL